MPRSFKPLSILLYALTLPALLHAAPLPPITDEALSENQRRIQAMQEQQEQLRARVRKQLAAMPKADSARLASDPKARAQEKRRQQLAKRLEAIERRMQEENSRPRKRFLSPRTMGATYAQYYHDMRCKIEKRGTENFPQAGGYKLNGELMMALLINHDGSLLDVHVEESSGSHILDRLAEDVVKSSAPFGGFTPEMRKDADQIDIVTLFKFRNDTAQADAGASIACD